MLKTPVYVRVVSISVSCVISPYSEETRLHVLHLQNYGNDSCPYTSAGMHATHTTGYTYVIRNLSCAWLVAYIKQQQIQCTECIYVCQHALSVHYVILVGV